MERDTGRSKAARGFGDMVKTSNQGDEDTASFYGGQTPSATAGDYYGVGSETDWAATKSGRNATPRKQDRASPKPAPLEEAENKETGATLPGAMAGSATDRVALPLEEFVKRPTGTAMPGAAARSENEGAAAGETYNAQLNCRNCQQPRRSKPPEIECDPLSALNLCVGCCEWFAKRDLAVDMPLDSFSAFWMSAAEAETRTIEPSHKRSKMVIPFLRPTDVNPINSGLPVGKLCIWAPIYRPGGDDPNGRNSAPFRIPTTCWPDAFEGRVPREVRVSHCEAAIHLCKAALSCDEDTYRALLAGRDGQASPPPLECRRLGHMVRGLDMDAWEKAIATVARAVVAARFWSGSDAPLLATGTDLLALANQSDPVWGNGLSAGDPRTASPREWCGANVFGWALMEIRAEAANFLSGNADDGPRPLPGDPPVGLPVLRLSEPDTLTPMTTGDTPKEGTNQGANSADNRSEKRRAHTAHDLRDRARSDSVTGRGGIGVIPNGVQEEDGADPNNSGGQGPLHVYSGAKRAARSETERDRQRSAGGTAAAASPKADVAAQGGRSGQANAHCSTKRERTDIIISPDDLPTNWDQMNYRQRKDYLKRHRR